MGIVIFNKTATGDKNLNIAANPEISKQIRNELSDIKDLKNVANSNIAVIGPIENCGKTNIFVTGLLDGLPESKKSQAFENMRLALTQAARKYFGTKEIQVDYGDLTFTGITIM